MELCGCCREVFSKPTLNFNQRPVAALATLVAAIILANIASPIVSTAMPIVIGVISIVICGCVGCVILVGLVVVNKAISVHNYLFPSLVPRSC